jgi:predicted ATPase
MRRRPHESTVGMLVAALSLTTDERERLVSAARVSRGPRPSSQALDGGMVASAPTPPTPLIGREGTLEELSRLVCRPDVRLVTLTGAPGVGKTRLALAVASALRPDFPDGVHWVSLAPLSDASLVWPTVRQALDLNDVAGQPLLETLSAYLRPRRALLLIDNFEQVLLAAPVLADLVARCPELRVLVTSRSSVHVRGEHRVVVPPLSLPDRAARLDLDLLARTPAVAMFVDRARGSWSEFALTTANAAAVADLCGQLDGLPLALELAAAWVPLLPPEALATRLQDHRLALLVGGASDLPDRQRTLSVTIQWSYDLLTEAERALFRRLCVFAGSAPLDAVDQVCRAAGDIAADSLQTIAALVDKNLVRRADEAVPAEVRVSMLATIREYGLRLMWRSGEEEATERAHTEHYLALARTAEACLAGPEQAAWLERLEREHDNLRAVLHRAVRRGEIETGLELAALIRRFWERHGHWTEGLGWLDRLLAGAAHTPPEVRARALMAAGILARRQSDVTGALARYEASLALYRSLGDRRGIFRALNNLGLVAFQRGELQRAVTLHRECLELCRVFGSEHEVAQSLGNLAIALQQLGDPTEARVLLEEGLELQRALGDAGGASMTLVNLGDLARAVGDHHHAEALLQEAVRLAREIGDEHTHARAVMTLGHVALAVGDSASARSRCLAGLAMSLQLGDLEAGAYALECLAAVAVARKEARRAGRLYGAAEALRDRIGAPPVPAQRLEHEQALGELRDVLGEVGLAAALSAGRLLTPAAAAEDDS